MKTNRSDFLRLLSLGAIGLGAAPAALRASSAAAGPQGPADSATADSDTGEIIDLHTHWFSPSSVEILSRRTEGPRFVSDGKGGWSVDRGAAAADSPIPGRSLPLSAAWFDIDVRLRHLDENGVRRQLVSWPTTLNVDPAITADEARTLWGAYNNDLSGLVQKHSDRLSGVAVLATADIEWSARELERAHDQLGLIGAVLPANGFATLEGAKRFAPIFEVAQRHGSHIYLHTGYANAAIPGQPATIHHGDSRAARGSLDNAWQFAAATITLAYTGFLEAYPGVTVQIAQLGGSGAIALVAEQVRLGAARNGIKNPAGKFERIYLDTGAAGNGPEAVALAVRVFGAEQVVFGTDFGPSPSVAPIIEHIRQAPISAAERRTLWVDNGRRILAAHGVT